MFRKAGFTQLLLGISIGLLVAVILGMSVMYTSTTPAKKTYPQGGVSVGETIRINGFNITPTEVFLEKPCPVVSPQDCGVVPPLPTHVEVTLSGHSIETQTLTLFIFSPKEIAGTNQAITFKNLFYDQENFKPPQQSDFRLYFEIAESL